MINVGEFSIDGSNFRTVKTSRRVGFVRRKETFGNTLHQSYVPIFLLHPANGVHFRSALLINTILGNDCSYSWPSYWSGNSCSSYSNLYYVLNNYDQFYTYNSVYKEEPVVVQVHRGLLQDESGNVLYLLTCDKNVKLDEAKPSDLKAYISNKFFQAQYTNIYKKLLKDYFQPMMEAGVSFTYTSEDIKEMFVSGSIKVEGNSIEELKQTIGNAKSLLGYSVFDELRDEAIRRGILNDDLLLPRYSMIFLRKEDQYLYDWCLNKFEITCNEFETEIPYWHFLPHEEEDEEEETEDVEFEDDSYSTTVDAYTTTSQTLTSDSSNSRYTVVDDTGDDPLPF